MMIPQRESATVRNTGSTHEEGDECLLFFYLVPPLSDNGTILCNINADAAIRRKHPHIVATSLITLCPYIASQAFTDTLSTASFSSRAFGIDLDIYERDVSWFLAMLTSYTEYMYE